MLEVRVVVIHDVHCFLVEHELVYWLGSLPQHHVYCLLLHFTIIINLILIVHFTLHALLQAHTWLLMIFRPVHQLQSLRLVMALHQALIAL